jgi:hypothetical protein
MSASVRAVISPRNACRAAGASLCAGSILGCLFACLLGALVRLFVCRIRFARPALVCLPPPSSRPPRRLPRSLMASLACGGGKAVRNGTRARLPRVPSQVDVVRQVGVACNKMNAVHQGCRCIASALLRTGLPGCGAGVSEVISSKRMRCRSSGAGGAAALQTKPPGGVTRCVRCAAHM